jgi:uncharacterized protein
LDRVRARTELIAFFAMTFAITWGLAAALLFFRPWLVAVGALKGPLNQSWIYYLAVYAPSISALILSLAFGGWSAVGRLIGAVARPAGLAWIALAIFTLPAVMLVVGAIERFTGQPGGVPHVDLHALLVTAPLMALTTPEIFTDPGAFGEEAGWRGFALPRLLQQVDALWAGIILGVVWMIWHLPAFFAAGASQAGQSYGWFFLAGVALSVFMAWLYVNANGNWLVAGSLPHMASNLMFDAQVTRHEPTQAFVGVVVAFVILAVFGMRLKAGAPAKAAIA